MINLLKNVARSFKKNKLSICGLSFLVFLSVGIYTALSGTTSAINKEYKWILKEGNLHDFTVSELYNVGVVRYSNNVEKFKGVNGEDIPSCLYNDNLLSKINIIDTDGTIIETVIAPYVTITGTRTNANVSISYTVDVSNCDDNASLKNFYLDSWISHLNNPSSIDTWTNHIEYLQPTISYQIKNLNVKTFAYFTETQKSYGKGSNDYVELSKADYDSYYNALKINDNTQKILLAHANDLYSIIGQENTLMSQYLSNILGVSEFRNFTSLNIDNSSDNIYYKVIKSNPTDIVDSLVSIDPNNGINKTQWNNFDVKDCTFNVLDFKSNDNWSLNQTLKYIPSQISDGFDIHYIEKIYLLNKGDWTEIPSDFNKIIDNSPLPTNNEECQNWWDTKKKLLTTWWNYENNNQEQVYCKDDRVTIQWTNSFGSPSAWSISNWTSHFAVVNPEFLKENNLHTLDPSTYNEMESYKQYVNNNPSITDQKMLFIGWINSLNYPDFENWFESIYQNPKYKNQFIIPGGASPYLIIGSGITPDFIYPIVSMEKLTPNPKKECIYFVNDAGYGRIFDSFRNNLNENYIVGKFTSNNKKIQQETLNKINEYAASKMIYPKGIKAAYFSTDMNNVLNASSFRISYIPKFINIINLTSISLTLFIILLSLVICAIVIHRYITNQQSTLGIMRANGFSTKQIATSMLPFAMTPTIIGVLLGVIVGTLLELTVLGLFSNYWMLPTKLLGFNWIGFVTILFISLAIFISTVYFTSLYVLRKNTVDLMKRDSQNNPNLTSRSVKKVFGKFGIMTKFRVSVAFNSIWKLIVLVIMTSLSLSTLMFTFSISGKFKTSTSLTNKSRGYNYAVDLITPTTQGGQYIGVNFDKTNNNSFGFAGVSGFNQAGSDSRDINYVQSLYYGDCSEVDMKISGKLLSETSHIILPGIEYRPNASGFSKGFLPKKEDSNGNEHDLNYFLNKKYYFSSMLSNYLNVTSSADIDFETEGANKYLETYYNSMMSSSQDTLHSNLFIPFMGDSFGQQTDIFYLKDRMLTNSTLNYFLGSLGIESNPWDIAASLMPDNNKKLLEKANVDFVNFIANAIYYQEGQSSTNYKELHDLFVNANDGDEKLSLYKEFIKALESDPTQYIINTATAVGDNIDPSSDQSFLNVAMRPSFLNLLTTAYAYTDCAEKDYYITYNTIPMLKEDETYTWIDASVASDNASAKIMGIKTGEQTSKYINLFDQQKNNLNDGDNSLIRYTKEQFKEDYKTSDNSWNYNFDKPFPIIANAYAAHKYNLKVGSEISFFINNRIDRYLDEINNSSLLKHIAKFKVVGICTTYEGQEYYIDQDVANLLLGLKTHLWDGEKDGRNLCIQSKYQPNHYYAYEYESLENPLCEFNDSLFKPFDKKGINVPCGNDMLINLNDYEDQMYDSGYNLTPYGFNGVFTKSMNGGPILTKGVILYSTTGLYPGNDKLTSEVTTQLLSYGANLELLRRVTLNGDLSNELSKKISNAYNDWINAPNNEKEQKHKILESYAPEAVNLIHDYFGDQAYTLVVANVSDAFSSQLIYDHLSSTISNITYAVIAVVSLMVIIIVALITNMVINDSKRLASLLKALGYTDGENASSFLAIYIPVIIFSLGISLLLSWGLITIYNSLIFNGMSIWLNTQIKWYNYLISAALVSVIFGVSGLNSAILLKHTSLVDSIK